MIRFPTDAHTLHYIKGNRFGVEPDCAGKLTTNGPTLNYRGAMWLLGTVSPCLVRTPMPDMFWIVDDRQYHIHASEDYFPVQGPFFELEDAMNALVVAHVAKRLEGK